MKKKGFSAVITAILLLSLMAPASALNGPPARGASHTSNNVAEIIPRAEQFEWYYRIIDGQMQKRLWSITEGKWLTEWTDV